MHKTDPDGGCSSLLHSRRHLLASIAAAGIASASGCSTPQLLRHAATAQTVWIPEPPQPPTKEDFADLGDVRLWYSDTGGTGEPVVVLHPMTGSDAIWSYQRPAFVDAGFRFIAYSRRGHGKSESGPPNDPGYGARDLEALTRLLGLSRFHLLGTAAGGFLAPDFALSYPDRLLSLVIACSLGGITDSQYRATTARITGPDFYRMPSSFRELGPSYRAACPEGVRRWEELEHASRSGPLIQQSLLNDLSWEAVARITAPTLVLTGDADLYQPPSRMREFASHIQNSSTVVIPESGHSAYWEQPMAFNSAVLSFLKMHRA
jgi:pimeloyl-ACP methyl ester carboxylesterase